MPIYTSSVKKIDTPVELFKEANQGNVIFLTFLTPIARNNMEMYNKQKALLCQELEIPLSFINSQPVIVALPMSHSLLNPLLTEKGLLKYKITIQAIRGVRHSLGTPPKCTIDLDFTEIFSELSSISDTDKKNECIDALMVKIDLLLKKRDGIERIKSEYPDVYGMAQLFRIVELKPCGYIIESVYEENLNAKGETFGIEAPQYEEYKNGHSAMRKMAKSNAKIINIIMKVSNRMKEDEEILRELYYQELKQSQSDSTIRQENFLSEHVR